MYINEGTPLQFLGAHIHIFLELLFLGCVLVELSLQVSQLLLHLTQVGPLLVERLGGERRGRVERGERRLREERRERERGKREERE